MLDDERSRPRGDFIPISLPNFFAGAFVERNDERLALVIPIDYDEIACSAGIRLNGLFPGEKSVGQEQDKAGSQQKVAHGFLPPLESRFVEDNCP
jgi:hypothetical protein